MAGSDEEEVAKGGRHGYKVASPEILVVMEGISTLKINYIGIYLNIIGESITNVPLLSPTPLTLSTQLPLTGSMPISYCSFARC